MTAVPWILEAIVTVVGITCATLFGIVWRQLRHIAANELCHIKKSCDRIETRVGSVEKKLDQHLRDHLMNLN